MTRILALDTSTEACSCALYLDGEVVEDFAVIPRQHAHSILPMIGALLASRRIDFSDLDALAWGRGPGSFTGLRIAAGVVQGLALAAQLPVVSVSTLAALALQQHQAQGAMAIFSCLDARIEELYWAAYHMHDGEPQLRGEEQLCSPDELPVEWLRLVFAEEAPVVAGNGATYAARFPQSLRSWFVPGTPDLLPRAAAIVRLAAAAYDRGEAVTALEAQPLYLRDKVTHA